MGETGKRSHNRRDNRGDGRNQKRRAMDRDEKGDDELIVYRILCPDGFIGSVIGKSGNVINSIRQETKARVKVVDPFPGAKDRVITIYCYVKEKEEIEVDDEFDDHGPLCPAQDALLKVHEAIANAVASFGDSDKKRKDKEECQILIPSSQSANIIGKSGATIKKLRSMTRTNIKVTPKDASDPTHSCAMEFDNFVLITGDPEAVKKALFAISTIMYKFRPKEEISLDINVPEALPSIIIPSDMSIYSTGGLYPSLDAIVSSRTVPPVLGTAPVELSGYADKGSNWPMYPSALPVVSGYSGTSNSEELIVRVLCPSDKIGRVIGRGGGSIKNIRETSGASVEVDDKKADRDACIITITSTESSGDYKSMAVEAVLLLQEKINDDEDEDTVTIQLLVPSKVIGCIIGKSGSIISEIRKRTKADIRISKGKKPRCADVNDELVELVGEVGSIRDALISIVLRLREDVLKHREGDHNPSMGANSLYSGGTSHSVASVMPSGPLIAPLGYDRRVETGSGLPMLSSSNVYGYEPLQMEENGYGSVPSYSSKLYGGLPPPSTLEMVVPAYAVSKVMGKAGANIANIRQISGASVEISESKSSRGDRVALISGTPEQKRSAENLIQAFIMAA